EPDIKVEEEHNENNTAVEKHPDVFDKMEKDEFKKDESKEEAPPLEKPEAKKVEEKKEPYDSQLLRAIDVMKAQKIILVRQLKKAA
ncbi:MAG: hypothetical protein HY350_04710, partial [Candidatus Omnitrophica bacterium]|nr:hypothetical protein [Candidatus Omnitrophota bacterium]